VAAAAATTGNCATSWKEALRICGNRIILAQVSHARYVYIMLLRTCISLYSAIHVSCSHTHTHTHTLTYTTHTHITQSLTELERVFVGSHCSRGPLAGYKWCGTETSGAPGGVLQDAPTTGRWSTVEADGSVDRAHGCKRAPGLPFGGVLHRRVTRYDLYLSSVVQTPINSGCPVIVKDDDLAHVQP
jgi:hypothetical protein